MAEAAGVGPDKVPLNRLAGDGVGGVVRVVDGNAGGRVARDEVAGRGAGPADEAVRPGVDHDAVLLAEGDGAGRVEADDVALDDGVRRAGRGARGGHRDAVLPVARDDVARSGDVAADGVAGGVLEEDAGGAELDQAAGAGQVGADVVALDDVAGRSGVDEDLRRAVRGHDVARCGVGPADRVSRSSR